MVNPILAKLSSNSGGLYNNPILSTSNLQKADSSWKLKMQQDERQRAVQAEQDAQRKKQEEIDLANNVSKPAEPIWKSIWNFVYDKFKKPEITPESMIPNRQPFVEPTPLDMQMTKLGIKQNVPDSFKAQKIKSPAFFARLGSCRGCGAYLKDFVLHGLSQPKIANKEKQLKGVLFFNGNRMIFMSRNCVKNVGGSFELVILFT